MKALLVQKILTWLLPGCYTPDSGRYHRFHLALEKLPKDVLQELQSQHERERAALCAMKHAFDIGQRASGDSAIGLARAILGD
jgi:hypothetical protein